MAKQLSSQILEYIDKNNETNSLDLSTELGQPHDLVIGAIKSLQTFDNLIIVKPAVKKIWEIVPEGQHILKYGSHEAVIYNTVPDEGIPQKELLKSSPYAKLGFSKAMAAGWIKLDNSNGASIVRKNVSSIADTVQAHLKNVENIPENFKMEYKKRNLLREVQINMFHVEKGLNFSTKTEKLEADLTSDLLAHGAWKTKKFKPYNFDALGAALPIGHLHPLLKVRHEFRRIFLEMGFTEMPTNNYVESSFWNFDALFQPQQHPARDAHDTFFVSEPRITTKFPMEYLERVKTVHSKGGYGSRGYRYDWKLEEAEKNLLRTHTTATSARMLYNLMQEGEFKPVKYFSIDKVFRNETLDATHLAEFHQIEGVVADYGLSLGDLIGILYKFFEKLGITQLRFKPAYNPYTEPSMEIFCYHDGLEKWIEIGNSGMFRPELLLPMNIPPRVNVLGWGLSLERPTMIKYDISNIRNLVGPKVDMEMVHNNPICRLEKIGRQAFYLRRKGQEKRSLSSRSNQEEKIKETRVYSLEKQAFSKQGYIIFCDPAHPIYFLESFLRFIRPYLRISVSVYVHSTVRDLPESLAGFCSEFSEANADTRVTLIWKIIGIDPVMELPNMRKIAGIVNIARYLNRLVELVDDKVLMYERNGPSYANNVDSYLDRIHCALHGVGNDTLHPVSETTPYALGPCISIVDIILESMDKRNVKK